MKCLFRLVLLGLAPTLPAFALENVTSIGTTITPGVPSVNDGNTFDNSIQAATTLSTATANYVVSSLVDHVSVRRNSVNADQSSVWYATAGADLAGVYQTSYDQMLITNNLYEGSDNTFANGTVPTTGNIERLDFTFDNARVASSGLRFGVFDRGAVGVHDSFAISAILSIDAFGNPTSYGTLLKVSAGWGGTTNAFVNQAYRLFRYNAGDNISTTTDGTGIGTQGIGGILISTADLGLADGTAVYGYSLMSNDVTDPLDPSTFPTNTDGNTGGGGIDLAALNGIEFQAVPEPATILLGLFAGLPLVYASRRKQG